jgi:hypothetical protein
MAVTSARCALIYRLPRLDKLYMSIKKVVPSEGVHLLAIRIHHCLLPLHESFNWKVTIVWFIIAVSLIRLFVNDLYYFECHMLMLKNPLKIWICTYLCMFIVHVLVTYLLHLCCIQIVTHSVCSWPKHMLLNRHGGNNSDLSTVCI